MLIYDRQKTSHTKKYEQFAHFLAAVIASIKSYFFIADIFGIPIAFAINLRLATVYAVKSLIPASISSTFSFVTFSSFSQAFLPPPVVVLAGVAALAAVVSSLVILTSYSFSFFGNDFSYSFNHYYITSSVRLCSLYGANATSNLVSSV